jgi:DNA-binding GntR family transcriptional regulator
MPRTRTAKSRARPDKPSCLARHIVRDRLVAAILSGRHTPGEQLRQQKLADELGVAQSAVREALIELQATGLIKAIDNRGMFVGDLSPQHVLDAFEVRERIEGLIAARCCQRITRAQVGELRKLAQQVADEAQAGRFDKAAEADSEMHRRLLQIAGNSMATRISEQYHVVGKLLYLGAPDHGAEDREHVRPPQTVLAEHTALLKAIEDGQEEIAENLMRAHVRAARVEIQKQIEAGHFAPHWLKQDSKETQG